MGIANALDVVVFVLLTDFGFAVAVGKAKSTLGGKNKNVSSVRLGNFVALPDIRLEL